ncbi:MAG: glycosyltransferase family 4 protein [Patescibacteria group bacterium]
MKPVLLATLEYPPQVGGIAEYLGALASQFPAGSLEVLAPETSGAHRFDVEREAVIYRRQMLAARIRPAWTPAFAAAAKLLKRHRYSALMVSHVLPMGIVARALGAAHKIPYVVIAHGMDVALALAAGGRKFAGASHVLNRAGLVVANSAFTAGLVRSFGVPADRIHVAYPIPGSGCQNAPVEQAIRTIRERHRLEGSFAVVSIGRLVARKGFDVCLDAVVRLRREGIPAKYLIVGDGPERARLARLAAHAGIGNAIELVGRVSTEELPAYHAAADVFVTAPRSLGPDIEGFGIVFLEANLMGKPVIGSRSGGVPEAVLDGETGILVNPGNPVELAAALRRLHRDPDLRRRLGEQGRARVQKEFTAKRQFLPLVEKIMALNPSQKILADAGAENSRL